LKQAPRAWYGRLRGFLFERGFEMGKVNQTLFLLRQGKDILIVQVYVDDIVFGGLSNSLVSRFAEDMSREFEMSMMGELQFFLGLQIKQSKEETFVHQVKYTKDIVRKFKMEDSKAMTTPMSTTTTLDADEEGEHVDQKEYRSMIGSLLYLMAMRLDIQFSVCLCTHFQASPRTSHVLTPKFGKKSDLWVQLDEESVRRKEGFFRCNRQKNPRSAICFRSAREQLS
jgi:hypothetical protein